MTDLRTAAQQALEALEAMQSYAAAERKGLRICDEAIPALRAALAEPNRAQKMRDAGYTRRPTLREIQAAAELRRLHAQRDALLEALTELVGHNKRFSGGVWDRARAVIKKAEESSHAKFA